MKKSTFYLAVVAFAATGTGFFGLSTARTAQAQRETTKSVESKDVKNGVSPTTGLIRCGTRSLSLAERIDEEKAVQAFLEANPDAGRRGGPNARNPGTVTVNVWFHIIRTDAGAGDISNDKIYAQLKVLNTAYSGRDRRPAQLGAALPQRPTANTICRFVLAGIDRTSNTSWYNATSGTAFNTMCNTLRRGEDGNGKTGPKTLNIYFKSVGGNLGFANYPSSYSAQPIQDGVFCLTGTEPGGSEPSYDLGKTAVHEVGHWMGLIHPFEFGCAGTSSDPTSPTSSTTITGDGVDDTEPENEPYFGSVPATYRDSCTTLPGRDAIENYMDYTDDTAMFQFTAGQDARMDSRILTFRGL